MIEIDLSCSFLLQFPASRPGGRFQLRLQVQVQRGYFHRSSFVEHSANLNRLDVHLQFRLRFRLQFRLLKGGIQKSPKLLGFGLFV